MQKHLRCVPGDVARYVLLPGDPGRARRIADRMDNARLIAENREYVVYTGTTNGIVVSVCSTGIGGPSASIALEELANIGAEIFIRVGSAGGRQPDIPIGTPVVMTAAYRGEGTSKAYLPAEFPAVADLDVTNALVAAARESGYSYRLGIGFTRDAYYVQNQVLNELLTRVGVVAAEQEAAVLFIVGTWRRVKVGAIVATDSNIWLPQQPTLAEKEALFRRGEQKVIDIALRTVRILAEQGI
ncbi:MAG TPA: nucleoside phosphorylase [Anaerolineae bacterium]|nr:nucleoside phosphorylase [Anaerolineae bacterium]